MAALCVAAGKNAVHVVLGSAMQRDIVVTHPEVKRVMVLNNAGLIDVKPPPRDGNNKPLTFGHLSNLTKEKGINIVFEATRALIAAGIDFKLVVAGPAHDEDAFRALDSARLEFGNSFEYLGPVYGREKDAFFSQIDIFLFPSQYENEAAPLVILEAMASGVACIAFDIGCIAEQVGADGGLAVSEVGSFADKCVEFARSFNGEASRAGALLQYNRLTGEYDLQIAEVIRSFMDRKRQEELHEVD